MNCFKPRAPLVIISGDLVTNSVTEGCTQPQPPIRYLIRAYNDAAVHVHCRAFVTTSKHFLHGALAGSAQQLNEKNRTIPSSVPASNEPWTAAAYLQQYQIGRP